MYVIFIVSYLHQNANSQEQDFVVLFLDMFLLPWTMAHQKKIIVIKHHLDE